MRTAQEMGSEGPKSVRINVTGFKKFHGVDANPTETIVKNLKNYVDSRGLPPGVTLGTCAVLETAGDGAVSELYKVLDSGISSRTNSSNEKVVWVSQNSFACRRINHDTFGSSCRVSHCSIDNVCANYCLMLPGVTYKYIVYILISIPSNYFRSVTEIKK